MSAKNGFARVGAIRTVKRTGDIGVYMGMTRHFPYKSGLAGVYPGNDMSSTRAFMLIGLPMVVTVIAIRTATKIVKSCNSGLRAVSGMNICSFYATNPRKCLRMEIEARESENPQ